MTRYLVATVSVHMAAAACDYLASRVAPEDVVWVVTVTEDDGRDGGDALNVARGRLAGHATVETAVRQGEPGPGILALADETDADEIVIGARSGEPGSPDGIGSTAGHVIASADRPVVVVPLPELA